MINKRGPKTEPWGTAVVTDEDWVWSEIFKMDKLSAPREIRSKPGERIIYLKELTVDEVR